MATKADAAIAALNDLINHMQQFQGFRSWMNDFIVKYNSEGYGTTWAALATCAQNADGSLGTADGSATAGHPIDTRTTTNAALLRAVTAAMGTSGITALQQLQNFCTNQAVTTGNYNQTINDLAG